MSEERQAEIDRLTAKLEASEHKEGMAQRCDAIRERLEELRNAD